MAAQASPSRSRHPAPSRDGGSPADPVRALHLFGVNEIMGQEMVTLNLLRFRRSPRLHHRALVLAEHPGTVGPAIDRTGVPWACIRRGRMRSPRDMLRAARALRDHVTEHGVDVILTNQAQAFYYARLAMRGSGVPVALYFMQVPHPSRWRNELPYALLSAVHPSTTFAASRRVAGVLAGWGVPSVEPVYHGTAVDPATPAEREAVAATLRERGVPDGAPLVVLPARLLRWKGQEVMIDAAPRIVREVPGAHVVLLGGTLLGLEVGFADELRRRIGERGMTNRVHLVGHQPVAAWLERASVVAHTSITPDAFPNVCIEAMALRRPLVTNTHSGVAEILRDGADARVVEPCDPDALAAAVVAFLQDPEGAARVAENGYRRYLESCTPRHMVDPVEAGLLRLVERARQERPSSR